MLGTVVDLSAVAVAGLSLLSMLVGFHQSERSAHRSGPGIRSAALGLGVGALVGACASSIVLLSVELEPERAVSTASVWSYVINIPAGNGLLISAGSAVLSIWLCRVAVTHGEGVPAVSQDPRMGSIVNPAYCVAAGTQLSHSDRRGSGSRRRLPRGGFGVAMTRSISP